MYTDGQTFDRCACAAAATYAIVVNTDINTNWVVIEITTTGAIRVTNPNSGSTLELDGLTFSTW